MRKRGVAADNCLRTKLDSPDNEFVSVSIHGAWRLVC